MQRTLTATLVLRSYPKQNRNLPFLSARFYELHSIRPLHMHAQAEPCHTNHLFRRLSVLFVIPNHSLAELSCRDTTLKQDIELAERATLHFRQTKVRPHKREETCPGLFVSAPTSGTKERYSPRTKPTCP